MRSSALCLLGCLMLFACKADDAGPGAVSAGTDVDGGRGEDLCRDDDGDGFGSGCDRGQDCDDADPAMTNECRVCAQPNEGCKCTPGTKPMDCTPEKVRTVMGGVAGTLVCTEGYRYCRDGVYSKCEIIQMYARFIPD